MTTTTITRQTYVTMLKHLVAGKDLDFVATVTKVPRDAVLDVVSKHGYPNKDRMAWAIDMLIQGGDRILERPTDTRGRVLLDEPAPTPRPVATITHIPPATADLLHQGKASPWIRTQNLAAKIHTLLGDLTARLADEQAAVEAKARVAHENALVASRIATLQAEIDKLKRKPPKPDKPAPTAAGPRSERLTRGVHPCTTAGCDRTFDTGQGAAAHRRRAHEGWNPSAKAAS